MIINDFNLMCIALPPDKTNSELIVDTYPIKQLADAKCLDDLRDKLASQRESSLQPESIDEQTPSDPPSLQTMLENAERNTATPEKVTFFVNTFFDNVKEKNLE